jgi:hypothetical protein
MVFGGFGKVEIKQSEGQTLLTLLRVAICGLASLSVLGMYNAANGFFGVVRDGEGWVDSLQYETTYQAAENSRVYNLYYDEVAPDGRGVRHIYKQYYLAGSEGAWGLVDSAGQVILESRYQDIILLPQSYILKDDDQWRFYSRPELEPLGNSAWDNVEVFRSESGKIISDLVAVEKDGHFGATDQQGNVVVPPEWDDCELNTYAVDWPIIRVKKDGLYGFINRSGQVVIDVSFNYAQLDLYSEPPPTDGEPVDTPSVPVVYVCNDGDWGGIFRDPGGQPQAVNWQIEPTAEVLEDYQNSGLSS